MLQDLLSTADETLRVELRKRTTKHALEMYAGGKGQLWLVTIVHLGALVLASYAALTVESNFASDNALLVAGRAIVGTLMGIVSLFCCAMHRACVLRLIDYARLLRAFRSMSPFEVNHVFVTHLILVLGILYALILQFVAPLDCHPEHPEQMLVLLPPHAPPHAPSPAPPHATSSMLSCSIMPNCTQLLDNRGTCRLTFAIRGFHPKAPEPIAIISVVAALIGIGAVAELQIFLRKQHEAAQRQVLSTNVRQF